MDDGIFGVDETPERGLSYGGRGSRVGDPEGLEDLVVEGNVGLAGVHVLEDEGRVLPELVDVQILSPLCLYVSSATASSWVAGHEGATSIQFERCYGGGQFEGSVQSKAGKYLLSGPVMCHPQPSPGESK